MAGSFAVLVMDMYHYQDSEHEQIVRGFYLGRRLQRGKPLPMIGKYSKPNLRYWLTALRTSAAGDHYERFSFTSCQ